MASSELIGRLKHNFDEVRRKQHSEEYGGSGIQVIIDDFNNILDQLKEEAHSNESIQEIEAVSPSGSYGGHKSDLDEIVLKTFRITEILDLDKESFEQTTADENLVAINLEQSQNQEQSLDVSITFDEIQSSIKNLQLEDQDQNELQNIASRFREEVENEENSSTLEELYRQAASISKDVAAQLIVFAVTHGVRLFV